MARSFYLTIPFFKSPIIDGIPYSETVSDFVFNYSETLAPITVDEVGVARSTPSPNLDLSVDFSECHRRFSVASSRVRALRTAGWEKRFVCAARTSRAPAVFSSKAAASKAAPSKPAAAKPGMPAAPAASGPAVPETVGPLEKKLLGTIDVDLRPLLAKDKQTTDEWSV